MPDATILSDNKAQKHEGKKKYRNLQRFPKQLQPLGRLKNIVISPMIL
jgi:hypothetical protein